jgi:hypothetical protein
LKSTIKRITQYFQFVKKITGDVGYLKKSWIFCKESDILKHKEGFLRKKEGKSMQRLRELRKKQGISLRTVADALVIS